MTPSPFTAGYEGFTRDGRKAGVYWVGDNELHGWITRGLGRRLVVWHLDGSWIPTNPTPDDIMPPKPETRTADVWVTLLISGDFHHGKPMATYRHDRIFAVVHLTAEAERGRRDDLKEQP